MNRVRHRAAGSARPRPLEVHSGSAGDTRQVGMTSSLTAQRKRRQDEFSTCTPRSPVPPIVLPREYHRVSIFKRRLTAIDPALTRHKYPARTESVPRCTAIDPSHVHSCPPPAKLAENRSPQGHLWREADVSRPRRAGRAAAAEARPPSGSEGRLGVCGLPPPEFGSPTGGLPPLGGAPCTPPP